MDSTKNGVDAERTMMWYAPRKPGSGWACTNKARGERLTAAGLVAPAGQAVIDAAKADGSRTLLDDFEDLVVPPDLAAALAAAPPAREHFDAFPRSAPGDPPVARDGETAVTRAGRIATTVEKAARGKRAQG